MYTYALLKTPTQPLTLPNGFVGSLRLVGSHNLSALVESDFDLETINQDDDRLIQAVIHHDQVIRAIFQQTTLLPLRFGTQLASQTDLLAYLAHQEPTYLAKLTELEGKAEYTLKFLAIDIALPDSSDWSTLKGRDYFLAKKQQYQAQQTALAEQAAELTELQQVIGQHYPNVLFSDAQEATPRCFLLASQPADTLLEQVQHWQRQAPHWQIQVSEALPPYHFV